MNDVTYVIRDIQRILKISKNTAYKLCTSGELKSIRVGNSIRITQAALDDYLNQTGDKNGQ